MTNMRHCFDTDHPRLPPLKKGVDDRSAIGGGIRFAATPQILRPRSARPAPSSIGGKEKFDFPRNTSQKIPPFFIEPSP
jgi:hypothetical protein